MQISLEREEGKEELGDEAAVTTALHPSLTLFVGDQAPQDDTHQDTGLNTGTHTCTFLTATHLKYQHSFPISPPLLIQYPEPIYDSNIFYSSYFSEIALHSSQHIVSKQHSKMQRLPDKIKCFLQDLLRILDPVILFLLVIDERSLLKPSSGSAVHAAQMKCWKYRKT